MYIIVPWIPGLPKHLSWICTWIVYLDNIKVQISLAVIASYNTPCLCIYSINNCLLYLAEWRVLLQHLHQYVCTLRVTPQSQLVPVHTHIVDVLRRQHFLYEHILQLLCNKKQQQQQISHLYILGMCITVSYMVLCPWGWGWKESVNCLHSRGKYRLARKFH